MALFDRAMKMFTPFAYRGDEVAAAPPAKATPGADDELTELKAQMAAMQAQLKALSAKK
jgi:polyhydroxyalkanoate synthesis regulator protein